MAFFVTYVRSEAQGGISVLVFPMLVSLAYSSYVLLGGSE